MKEKDGHGGSSLDEMKHLETEMTSLAQELEACKDRIRQLTLAERPREGLVYARELHDARQNKVRIEVEILARRNRLNRLCPSGPLQ